MCRIQCNMMCEECSISFNSQDNYNSENTYVTSKQIVFKLDGVACKGHGQESSIRETQTLLTDADRSPITVICSVGRRRYFFLPFFGAGLLLAVPWPLPTTCHMLPHICSNAHSHSHRPSPAYSHNIHSRLVQDPKPYINLFFLVGEGETNPSFFKLCPHIPILGKCSLTTDQKSP